MATSRAIVLLIAALLFIARADRGRPLRFDDVIVAHVAAQQSTLPFPAGAVSAAELQQALDGINYDRTSGREGERRAAAFLEKKLTEYGVAHTRYDVRAYLSWPVRAEVTVVGDGWSPKAVTAAFGASTPPGGLTAELWWIPDALPDAAPLGPDARGRIVVARGLVSPDSALRAQRAGAAAILHINSADILHEMIATTIWGAPTTESAERIPRIPVASISRSDGEKLKAAAAKGAVKLRLVTEVEQGWTTIPLVVADVRGASADFMLVATHIDAWYEGMTDTGGTVASILEMARVLQKSQKDLTRGVRFAWWPGHSFGRYAGSGWYVDHFWADLDAHAVAYTNLDGSGRRGSVMDGISARGWPGIGEYSREFVATKLKKALPPVSSRLFRPGRDSDSAFQGIGVPEFNVGLPGPPREHPDMTSGRVNYWHTAEDTLDKIDLKALVLDTQYRVAQLYDLATMPVLPHRIAPIAAQYEQAIQDLQNAAGTSFDLAPALAAAQALGAAAETLDAAPRRSEAAKQAALNALLVRLTHRLNSTLYTKAGRFDQDPAAELPYLPLLARARELPALAPESDAFGFLQTELLRGRNAVEATLREATEEIRYYLAGRNQ